MNKFTLRFFSLLLCCIGIFFCTSCNDEQTSPSSPVIITEINTPYIGDHLKITATEIKAVQNPTESHQISVGIYWIVENISNEEFSYKNGSLVAYVNNESVERDYGYSLFSNFGKELSYASLAPGKHTSGYFCVNIPEDAEIIEIHYTEWMNMQTSAIFKFDIPPVESAESDTATTTSTFNDIDQNNIASLITLEKYNQLKIGMTYNEVTELIGSDGTLFTETGEKGTIFYTVVYTYEGVGQADATVSLTFQGENIELKSKMQLGLE